MRTTVLSAVEIERAVRKAIDDKLSRKTMLNFTPIFPMQWPLEKNGNLVVFAYTTRPAPTGMVQKNVWTPRASVTIKLQNNSATVHEVELLEIQKLPEMQDRPLLGLSKEELQSGIDALLRVATQDQTAQVDLLSVKEIYNKWQQENWVIANYLENKVSDFFKWLNDAE